MSRLGVGYEEDLCRPSFKLWVLFKSIQYWRGLHGRWLVGIHILIQGTWAKDIAYVWWPTSYISYLWWAHTGPQLGFQRCCADNRAPQCLVGSRESAPFPTNHSHISRAPLFVHIWLFSQSIKSAAKTPCSIGEVCKLILLFSTFVALGSVFWNTINGDASAEYSLCHRPG